MVSALSNVGLASRCIMDPVTMTSSAAGLAETAGGGMKSTNWGLSSGVLVLVNGLAVLRVSVTSFQSSPVACTTAACRNSPRSRSTVFSRASYNQLQEASDCGYDKETCVETALSVCRLICSRL